MVRVWTCGRVEACFVEVPALDQVSREVIVDPRPVLVRVGAFVLERYPPVPQVVLVVLLWVTGVTMAVTLWAPSTGAGSGHVHLPQLIASLAGALLFVFHLRVFDDVKDAAHDRVNEPTRPIPRGLVSEREVDMLAIALLAVEAALFASVGTLTLLMWLIAAGFTVLMRVEFFIGSWLERHVLTYAISHMVSMGLVLASLIAAGIDTVDITRSALPSDVFVSWQIAVACVAAFVLGVGFELGRKFERYADAHGLAAWMMWVLCPTAGIAMMAIAVRSEYASWVTITLGCTAVATLIAGAVLTVKRPRPEPSDWSPYSTRRALVEAIPGLGGLVTYGVLAAAGIQALTW